MSNSKQQPQPPANQIPEFYVNSLAVNSSPYEFEIAHALIDSQGNLKGGFNVRMNPSLAKELSEILVQQVKDFEKNIGKIPQPPKP